MSIVISVDVNDRFMEQTVNLTRQAANVWLEDLTFDSLNNQIQVDIADDYVRDDKHKVISRYQFARAIEDITTGAVLIESPYAAAIRNAAREDEPRLMSQRTADQLLQVGCFGEVIM